MYDRDPAPNVKSTLQRLKERIAANVDDVYRSGEDSYSYTHNEGHRARGVHWMQSIRARAWAEPSS
jgi:hypothetical protein